ncbi:Alpha/Beta hydrolase protein [Phycomyces nitens]|nr:Alpha/Beta hydrolase protein [Phycomyces nitens]
MIGTLLVAALVSAYNFSVGSLTLFIGLAISKRSCQTLFGRHSLYRDYALPVEMISSLIAEYSLHIMTLKTALLISFRYLGFYSRIWPIQLVDCGIILALMFLFYQGFMEEATLKGEVSTLVGKNTNPYMAFTSANYMNKLINPLWTSSNTMVYPSITYATNEELREAFEISQNFKEARKMVLDIYTRREKRTELFPVLISLHGVGWQHETSNLFFPHEKDLVVHENWVVVNVGYRTSARSLYSHQIQDVKRAIRWIKESIHLFGGDPESIVLQGDSTGGHLAALVALTPNDPRYQPGFENVDTSIKGVISLSGVMDLESNPHLTNIFINKGLSTKAPNPEFIKEYNPLEKIKSAKEANALPKFLIVSCGRDTLVDSLICQKFKQEYDSVCKTDSEKNECSIMTLPNSRHMFYSGWSPRSMHLSNVIQTWCQQISPKST